MALAIEGLQFHVVYDNFFFFFRYWLPTDLLQQLIDSYFHGYVTRVLSHLFVESKEWNFLDSIFCHFSFCFAADKNIQFLR